MVTMETEQSALLSQTQHAAPKQPAPAPEPSASLLMRMLTALRRPSVLIATLALLLLGWQWLETRSRMSDLQEELARRLAAGDTVANESRALSKQNQEMLQALAAKAAASNSPKAP